MFLLFISCHYICDLLTLVDWLIISPAQTLAVQLLAKDENWTVGTLLSFQFRKLCGWGLDFNEYLLKGNQTTILTYAFPREDNKTGFYIQGSVVSYSIYSRLNKRGQIKYSTFETVNKLNTIFSPKCFPPNCILSMLTM